MESSARRRRRPGLKGSWLLMYLCRAPKLPSPVQYGSQVKPAPASTASVGYVSQEFPPVPPTPENAAGRMPTKTCRRRDVYGACADDGDENIDRMAANYISRMQEKFRLGQRD